MFGAFAASNIVSQGVVEIMNEATKSQQQRGGAQVRNLPEDDEEMRREEMLDEALQATFPASDPLAITEPGAHRVVEAGHKRAA